MEWFDKGMAITEAVKEKEDSGSAEVFKDIAREVNS